MADPNEVQVKITANAKEFGKGFDDATKTLVKFNQSAQAAFQTAATKLVAAQEAAEKFNNALNPDEDLLIAKILAGQRQVQIAEQEELNRAQKEATKTNNELDAAQRKVAESTKKHAEAINTAKVGYLQTTPQIQRVIDSLRAMTEQFIVAGIIVGGFVKIVKTAFEFGKAGAELQRLEESGGALAKSFGVNLKEAAAAIKAASLGTITTQKAMLQTNRALLLGVAGDTQTLARLMEIAAIRGRAMGLDTSEAFDRIVLGIGRVSTRILDDIGIVVNGEKTYSDYAKAIGISVQQLSDQQKRVALTNAIIEDGNKLLAASGGLVDDNASAYSRFSTHVADSTNEIKKHLADAITPLITALDQVIFREQMLGLIETQHASETLKSSKSYQEYAEELDRAAKAAGYYINNNGDLINLHIGMSGTIVEVVVAHHRLTEAEYNTAKATDTRREAIEEMRAEMEAYEQKQRELTEAIEEFNAKLSDMHELSEGFDFDQAALLALAGSVKLSKDELDQLAIQLGVMDEAFLKFKQAMAEAAKDGEVSAEEVRKAWSPIGFMQLDKLKIDFDIDTENIEQKFRDLSDEIDKDFAAQREKHNLDLAQKLADIAQDEADKLEDLQRNLGEKREDLARDKAKKLKDIEIDYQRQIRQIMQRFEMSRLHALIDLNGKALFEAEAQRDMDLANAKENAKEKRDDEEDNYEEALEDLEDYEKKQREQIAKDEERKRRDAQQAFEQQRADAKLAAEKRRADASADRTKELTELNAAYKKQKEAILVQLGLINKDNRKMLTERMQDFLDYISSSENILKALAAGTVSIDKLRSDFLKSGGIPFGGIPYVPPVTQPPQPPTCPVGQEWDGVLKKCVPIMDLPSGPSMPTSTSGSSEIKVTLNVQGDGVLAQAVREASLNAIIDVIRV